jgi:hypothetical protein
VPDSHVCVGSPYLYIFFVLLTLIRRFWELFANCMTFAKYHRRGQLKMLLIVLTPNKNKDKNPRPKKGVRTEKTARRRKMHCLYGTTRELYKKNPGVLGKYIRAGIPWLDNNKTNNNPADIRTLYTALWSSSPEIAIQFVRSQPSTNEIPTVEFRHAITKKNTNAFQ